MNRTERRRQAKHDAKQFPNGVDPESGEPRAIAAVARHLYALFENAKRTGRVEAPVKFLYDNVTATLAAHPMQVACARGCSHCCNGWVSVSAPEILFLARAIRANGEDLLARVQVAHESTRTYSKDERPDHPHPCPMLKQDACSLYDARPSVCRLSASMDADVCMKRFRLREPGAIPTPPKYLKARALYEFAVTAALTRAGLPYRYYDLTAGLAHVLAREDAEAAWLAGEDVFDGVPMDPIDVMSRENARLVYREAFGHSKPG